MINYTLIAKAGHSDEISLAWYSQLAVSNRGERPGAPLEAGRPRTGGRHQGLELHEGESTMVVLGLPHHRETYRGK
ncbi:MAG: hypothetical protein ACYC5O_24465 [Anaerolineae bacterium]